MSNNHREWLRIKGVWLLLVGAILLALYPARASAATNDDFNIQVSPSPLTILLTPGQRQTATITVRNLSNHSETLTPRLSGFTVDDKSQKIDLRPVVPLGLDQWIHFSQSSLTIGPGGSQALDIIYNTPSNVGFNYSLAITLSPANQKTEAQGATYHASIAVFNLININRPDAKRELKIDSFKAGSSHYEYLPARFNLTVKNNGNIIDQPTGNLFIQRSFDDPNPIIAMPLNPANSYVLPGTSRTLTSQWSDGFPHYVTTTAAGGTGQKTVLSWDWRHLNNLRIGKYVAKVVMVYNDGQRDVPVVASYSFWVIPWKLILGVILVSGLVLTGLFAWGRLFVKGTGKVRKYVHRK